MLTRSDDYLNLIIFNGFHAWWLNFANSWHQHVIWQTLTCTHVCAIEFAMHIIMHSCCYSNSELHILTACWQLRRGFGIIALHISYWAINYLIIVMPHLPQVGPRRGICILGGFGPTWDRWGMTLIGALMDKLPITFLTEWIHCSALGCWGWSLWSGEAAPAVPSQPGHWKQCELCHLLCQYNHVVLQ